MDARTTEYSACPSRMERVVASKPLVLINHLVEAPGKLSGITRYAFGLIEALVRRGNARYVLATTWEKCDLPTAIGNAIDDVITLNHVRSTPLSFVSQFGRLRKIASRLEPDFLYAVSPMCPALPGVPSLITVHDLYYDIMPHLYARRHRLWWNSYFAGPARMAHTIACVSQNTANDLVRHHPHLARRTALVPGAGVLGHAARDAVPQPNGGMPYILLLGNVTPNKNVKFLVDALAHLHAHGRPVRAIHVGQDHSGELARALAGAPAGLMECRGGLDDDALDTIMRNAAALVQPSLYEGFGLPIIEAHERGVPVIASDIEVFREVAGDGGLFAPLGNPPALAEAIHSVLQDEALRKSLATAAKSNAHRYSWDQSAAAAEKIVSSATAAAPKPL